LPPQANKIRLPAQADKAAHLDGKAMTPLLPAPRNNPTPMLASHPLKKAVHALTPAVVRLIRPLHNVPSEFRPSTPRPSTSSGRFAQDDK
jgi:hypothetical protein